MKDITAYRGGYLGSDVKLKYEGDLFFEVIAQCGKLRARGTFAWPSNEVYVRVRASDFEKWGNGKK